MPLQIDIIDFIVGLDPAHWPQLTAGQADVLNLHKGSLAIDANQEVLFLDNGQLRSFDNTHRLVFDRANNLLDLHEQGAIRFLTGAPNPTERLRIAADGKVGIGTATPTHALEVNGVVNATDFLIGGNPLPGSPWAVQGADISFSGKVGLGTTTPTHPLHIASTEGLRQNSLYISGSPGGSSFSYNAHRNAANNWVFPDPGRQAVTMEMDDMGGRSRFQVWTTTAANKTTWIQRLAIDGETGNVGIGTGSPNGRLDVANLVRLGLDEGGSGPRVISFAKNAGDEVNAGKIAYRAPGWDAGALHIVGAGGAPRRITLWDDVTVPGNLSFGSLTRQMINLWSTQYGIGVQSGTQYFRTGGDFAWHLGGTHSHTAQNPGGGTRLMVLNAFGDLILSARTNPSADPARSLCRALVDLGNQLAVNFNHDYVNGVRVMSNLFVDANGFKPGGGFWASTSDRSLKKNISSMEGVLDKLLRLRGVNFEWKEPEKQGNLTGTQMGLVAQEVEEVFPEWVGVDAEGKKYVAIRGFEALIIEALRELKTALERTAAVTDNLEKRVLTLEKQRPVGGF